jgi:chromosome segregation ATPase
MPRRGHHASTIGRLALTSAAAASLMLGGCNDDEQLSDIVERAGHQMVAATGGGVATPPAEVRSRTYSDVIRTLQSALEGAEKEPGSGAAKLLIAQAMVGQADIAAERATEIQRDVLYALAEARSRLDLHADRTTYAGSLGVYDPQEDLAQLSRAQAEIDRELEAERAALAQRQNRVAELRTLMEEARTGADAKRAEADQLRAEAGDADAVRRASLVARAHEIEREGASHERRYAELQLEANALEDEAKLNRIQIASHQRREELVREARDRIESSGRLLDEESRQADMDARDLGSELGGTLDAIVEMLDQQLRPAFDEAVGKYRAGASQAQQARGDMGNVASALATTAQHASANLHRTTAEVYASVITVAERLGRDLGSSRFAELAQSLRLQHDEILGEAADLYDSAGFSDFAGGLRGDAPAPEDDELIDEGTGEPEDGVESATDVPE